MTNYDFLWKKTFAHKCLVLFEKYEEVFSQMCDDCSGEKYEKHPAEVPDLLWVRKSNFDDVKIRCEANDSEFLSIRNVVCYYHFH